MNADSENRNRWVAKFRRLDNFYCEAAAKKTRPPEMISPGTSWIA